MKKNIEEQKNTLRYVVIATNEADAPILQETILFSTGQQSQNYSLEELKDAAISAAEEYKQ